jgi:predicted transposase YbfD/YdcC
MSLQVHLAQIPEFRRQNKNFRHFLVDVLAISVLATLCGADDFEEIALFGQQKEALLRRYLLLPYGPPSADTISRVFQKLDVARFNACFMAWMHEVLPPETAGQLCIDGKTLRGSGPKPLHVVSAVASASGLSLAQVAGQGKGQELGAVPDLLALLDVRGALVSLDALSCQPTVAQQIIEQGGDYLLGLKANQPTLLAAVEHATHALPIEQAATRWAYAGDGTPVRYRVWTQADRRWVDEDGRWPGLHTLVRVETMRPDDQGQPLVQQRYYISSRALTPPQADAAVRGHWAIENALHWQLDVTFGEDDHLLRHHQAAQNLTLVRKMALNLLKQDPTKRSIKNKRKRLAWDEPFLERLLAALCQDPA